MCIVNDCCSVKNPQHYFKWTGATVTGPLNASTLYNVTDSHEVIPGAASVTTTATTTVIANDPSAPASSGPPQGSVIGLGVGLGIPLLIALGTIVWLLFALRKERRNRSNPSSSYVSSGMPPPSTQQKKLTPTSSYVYSGIPPQSMQQKQPTPAELYHDRDPAEVAA